MVAKWPGPVTPGGNGDVVEPQVDHYLAERADRAQQPGPAPFPRHERGMWLAAVSPTADGWLLQILRHGREVWSTPLDLDLDHTATAEDVLDTARGKLAIVGHDNVSEWRSAGWIADIE